MFFRKANVSKIALVLSQNGYKSMAGKLLTVSRKLII